ncbi:uncharacterized protein LOC126576643 [Anopheles aquasalis]|uniref:uncharacterized protein LOC126576643 n=1 Tax=Anopheles aquasalis TaxID=42839 RepID=UPI00215B26DB|nr:uncharacterized protein LOC126576643 [Anopheles aquasalis]
MPSTGNGRARKRVSEISAISTAHCLLVLLLVIAVGDRAGAINYRKDTGYATDGRDQFVFREPATSATSVGPRPGTVIQFQAEDVKRTGRVRFGDVGADSYPAASAHYPGSSSSASGSNFFGASAPVSSGSSPNTAPFSNRDRERDQFYTVGASIQFAGNADAVITPPPPLAAPSISDGQSASYQQKIKRKKNKYKYQANQKVYNVPGNSVVDQSQYAPYLGGAGGQRFGGVALQSDYPTAGAVVDNSIGNYPELQRQQYPFSMSSAYPGGYGYQGQQSSPVGGGLYQQYPPQYPYQSPYATSSPYTSPYYHQQQPQFPAGSNQPPNAQSILGVLQSIFNFAPGTFGGPAVQGPQRPGSLYGGQNYGGVQPGFQGGVGGQLRQALDNIADNDELQCVPKLICMMSRSSSGQGFSSYVNRGLLSTILSAVPDSSPWLKFSRAALLGYGIGANSCDAYYPKCPKDEMEILYYLNNHRGGFFRFFSNGDQQSLTGQQQQQQQYG